MKKTLHKAFLAAGAFALAACALADSVGRVEYVSVDLAKRTATVAWTWTDLADSAVRLSLTRNGDDFPTAGWGGSLFIGDGTTGCAVGGTRSGFNELFFDVGRDNVPTNGRYAVQIIATNEAGRVEEWVRGSLTVRANPAAEGMPASWSAYADIARKVAPLIDCEGLFLNPANADALWGAVSGRAGAMVTNCVEDATAATLQSAKDYADAAIAGAGGLTPEMVTNIVLDVAPAPGDYAAVSNAAMNAAQNATNYTDALRNDLDFGDFTPWRSINSDYADEAIGLRLDSGIVRDADDISTQLDAATQTNALQDAAIAGKASNSDVQLTPVYSEWVYPSIPAGCSLSISWQGDTWIVDFSIDDPLTILYFSSGALGANCTTLSFDYGNGTVYTATRSIVGYILGAQTDKVLASTNLQTGVSAATVTNIVRDLSLGGIWDSQLEVWWTPRMRNGSLTYEATTNVNLNAGN